MEFFSMFEMWLKQGCPDQWLIGGLDIWDPLMKAVVYTYWYPDSNPKAPGPKPPIFTISWWELPLFEVFACGQVMLWNLGEGASECWTCSSLGWWNDWIQNLGTRWAPTSYKWTYNPTYPFIRPFKGVISLLITSRGPPCSFVFCWGGHA